MPKPYRVLRNYGGAPSAERRIEAGKYKEEDDPRLLGLARYLMANGHATGPKDKKNKSKKGKGNS